MPTLLKERGYSFRFRASDGGEPPHVHVRGNDGVAKVWLGDLELANATGYTQRQWHHIRDIMAQHQDEFLEKWHEFFG